MVNLELFRELPAIDELIRSPQLNSSIQSHGSVAVADAARAVLGRLRDQIASELLDAESLRVAVAGIAGAIETEARKSLTHHLRSVINATGVILHTNLGRAPLANQTLAHVLETANQYSNLEFDLNPENAASATSMSIACFASSFRRLQMSRLSSSTTTPRPCC